MVDAGDDGLRELAGVLQARKQQATSSLNSTWEILTGSTKFADSESPWGSLTDAERQQCYTNHSLVRACVALVCGAYRKAPLEAGTVDDEGGFARSSLGRRHPVLRLLRRPNPEMTQSDLFGQDVARLLLTGKSYVWKWRNAMGGVTELWPLPTHWVKNKSLGTINPDPASGDTRRTISHFQVRVPGGVGGSVKKYDVPVEDMVYRRFFDPHSLTGGSSTFTAAYRPYKLDMERGDYMIELLKNMYSPGPVLYQDEEPGRPQMDEMRAALRDKIGPGKRGSPLFLWGKNARVDMIAPLKDLDWAGFAAMNESQICSAFGTPPLLVHARVAQENSPLSTPNLSAASMVFYENTMAPLWVYSAEAWTRGLMEEVETDEVLRHNTSGIEALQADRAKVAEEVERAVRSGAMPLAEAQRRLNIEPDPELEGVYILPMNVTTWKPGEPEPEPEPGHGEEEEDEL